MKSTVLFGSLIVFCGLLFFTLLILKITSIVDWSWWWITAPIWGPVTISAIIFAIAIVVAHLLIRVYAKLYNEGKSITGLLRSGGYIKR